MRQGIFDSDVFCVFLTFSLLNRTFCLKEITWALEFKKPVVVIVEQDDRFFAWKGSSEVAGRPVVRQESLQDRYAKTLELYPPIIKLLQAHLDAGSMIPYRRREFEAEAMARELVRQVGKPGLPRTARRPTWGAILPPSKLERTLSLIAEKKPCNRSVLFICFPTSVELEIAELLSQHAKKLSLPLDFIPTFGASTVTHVLVVLTRSLLLDKGSIYDELRKVVRRSTQPKGCGKVELVFIDHGYFATALAPAGESDDDEVQIAIKSHEAVTYRSRQCNHEQDAMALELLRRIYT
jgi:hypothetical protein